MIDLAKQWFRRTRNSLLARNSAWMFLGYGLRILVQAAYFILIARGLGTEEYGAFVGVTALIAIVAPFASFGAGNLLVKNVSRDRNLFSEYWGNAIVVSLVSGLLLLAGVMAAARLFLPGSIPWQLILMVGISDLILVRGIDVAAQAFQAVDRLRETATLTLLPNVLRLISAAVVVIVWHHGTAFRWGYFYLGSTLLCSIFAVVLVTMNLGRPKLALYRIPGELTEGFYFSTGLSAQTVYNDLDKTMLARLSTLDATGIYAAAYRLVDVAFTPVRSVLNAAYPSFFRHGKTGVVAAYAFAKTLLPRMIGYSLLAFVVLFFIAPIIPFVLGEEYARTVEALRWLAVLPLLKTVHYFFADALTGAGYQGIRTATQVIVAVANVGLNLWLIPAYSWRGAAWASIASDGLLMFSLWIAIEYCCRREQSVAFVQQLTGD
jgi:O-antigen/teichoic acid export membrane protein